MSLAYRNLLVVEEKGFGFRSRALLPKARSSRREMIGRALHEAQDHDFAALGYRAMRHQATSRQGRSLAERLAKRHSNARQRRLRTAAYLMARAYRRDYGA